MFRKVILAVAALATLALPAVTPTAASAQYAPYQTYPNRSYGFAPEVGRYRVRGWVSAYDHFNLTVRTDGRMVPVNLHQGTVILPTGLRLQQGMFVSVDGYWNDVGFHADRIVLIR